MEDLIPPLGYRSRYLTWTNSETQTMRHAISVLFSVALLAGCSKADEFSDQLTYLKKQAVAETGRDAKIAGYKELLADHPEHPQRAVAMLAIANLWQIHDPANGIKRDSDQELKWLRTAASASEVASEIWFDVNFRIVGHMYLKDSKETRKILNNLIANSPNSIVDAHCQYELQRLAHHEKDYEEAERICLMLQEWMVDKDKQPKETYDKGLFYEWCQASAYSMMISWAEMRAPKVDRQAKIDGLLDKYAGRMYMDRYHRDAMDHLANLHEYSPSTSPTVPPPPSSRTRN